jgi:hypothetical protein
MIEKEKLLDMIISTPMEKVAGAGDAWEKYIDLEDNVLVVGYKEEEEFHDRDPDEELVRTFYWYWELRDPKTWDVLFEDQDKDFSFCESDLGNWEDQDRVEDFVGDISEDRICTWSEQDLIEDVAEDIANEVLDWLKTFEKK